MSLPVSVIALISTYNEADIIAQVVGDLVQQDISVYVVDDGSTDDTVAQVERFVGRGVIGIERFSAPDPTGSLHVFALEPILRRKAQLASELAADWFINHDADEFRESPWPNVSLRDAIQWVDYAGYNAIDFTCLEFAGGAEGPHADVRDAIPCYTPAPLYNRLQIRCWRKTDQLVDLVSSGGHEAAFPDRNVFPIRFVLRHYPIRGRLHRERKVLAERNYLETERRRGWHVQYEQAADSSAIPRTYDAQAVRLDLMLRHRDVEALEAVVRNLEARVEAQRQHIETLGEEIEQQRNARAEEGRQYRRELERLRVALNEHHQALDALYQSRSWRWTAPVRMLTGWLKLR
jgi:hypothetical protein